MSSWRKPTLSHTAHIFNEKQTFQWKKENRLKEINSQGIKRTPTEPKRDLQKYTKRTNRPMEKTDTKILKQNQDTEETLKLKTKESITSNKTRVHRMIAWRENYNKTIYDKWEKPGTTCCKFEKEGKVHNSLRSLMELPKSYARHREKRNFLS